LASAPLVGLRTSAPLESTLSNPKGTLPRHVAIIMDGNGRWAKARGLPRHHGHFEGVRAVRETVETAARSGVQYLTLYAFSCANWARPAIEVRALMRLMIQFADSEQAELRQLGIRCGVIGCLDDLPAATRTAVQRLVHATRDGDRMALTLALSYGGRQDVVRAARSLVARAQAGQLRAEDVDEALLRREMYTRSLPDVDLLIRTGGESRISDFLLLESAYAELAFFPLRWPDFRAQHLRQALDLYANRERRFGRTGDQLRAGSLPAAAVAARV
jgi:undecaprenyl diphosphate synthase